MFNQLNKDGNYIRLIQQRVVVGDCYNERFPKGSLNSFNCTNNFMLATSTWKNGNSTYLYQTSSTSKRLPGTYYDYDESGYFFNLQVGSVGAFYQEMDQLITSNWVDQYTVSVMIVVNFYNISIDLFLILRILYENINFNFALSNTDYAIIDLTPILDVRLIMSIITAMLCLLLMVKMLKLKNVKVRKKRKTNKKLTGWEKFKEKFSELKVYCNDNYRSPDLFEYITFLNFLFYFGCVIFRFEYYARVSNISLDPNGFNDLSQYSLQYEMISYLNSATILIFMFSVINHVSYISPEFKSISVSLINVSLLF